MGLRAFVGVVFGLFTIDPTTSPFFNIAVVNSSDL